MKKIVFALIVTFVLGLLAAPRIYKIGSRFETPVFAQGNERLRQHAGRQMQHPQGEPGGWLYAYCDEGNGVMIYVGISDPAGDGARHIGVSSVPNSCEKLK